MVFSLPDKKLTLFTPEITYDVVECVKSQGLTADTTMRIIQFLLVDEQGRKCSTTLMVKDDELYMLSIAYPQKTDLYLIKKFKFPKND